MPTRLRASARPSSPAASPGNGSGSVFDFRIFCEIISASSVRLMRLMSDGSDLDIFAVPSRNDITRAATAPTTGHRSEENTSELQSLMSKSYDVFCLKEKNT